MKIAFLLNSVSRNAGGLFEICRRLGQTLAERDEVSVLGVRDEFTEADLAGWTPLRPLVFTPALPGNLGVARGYAEELQRLDPSLVHVHALWIYPSLAGYRWSRRTKRPLIYTAHGMLDPWAVRNSGWKKRVVRALWEDAAHRSAACFHVNSEAEYRAVRAYGLTNPVCIIPNGIDLPEVGDPAFANRLRRGGQILLRQGSGGQGTEIGDLTSDIGPAFVRQRPDYGVAGRKTLLYLGRLHPKKNLGELLKAWRAIQKSEIRNQKSDAWVLAIAGWDQGGYEEELKSLARELGLSFSEDPPSLTSYGAACSGRRPGAGGEFAADTAAATASVLFLGPLFGEDKAAAYRDAAAFVLPSLSEGLPMVVLEAWAYGKPVLMTAECNLPEGFAAGAALRIGKTADEITKGLRELMEMSEGERVAMGARGYALVAEKFSWPQIGDEMRRVYDWVLGGGNPPDCVRLG